jgi:hypothetical protein
MLFPAWRAKKIQNEAEAEFRALVEQTFKERCRLIKELHPQYVAKVITDLPTRIQTEARLHRPGSLIVYNRDEFYKTCGNEDLGGFSDEYRERFLPFDEWKDHPGIDRLRKVGKDAGYKVEAARFLDHSSDYGDYAGPWSNWFIRFSW